MPGKKFETLTVHADSGKDLGHTGFHTQVWTSHGSSRTLRRGDSDFSFMVGNADKYGKAKRGVSGWHKVSLSKEGVAMLDGKRLEENFHSFRAPFRVSLR